MVYLKCLVIRYTICSTRVLFPCATKFQDVTCHKIDHIRFNNPGHMGLHTDHIIVQDIRRWPLIIFPPKTTNPLVDSIDSLRSATNMFTTSQIHYWHLIMTSQWILKTISQGYKVTRFLQFRRRPPLNTGIRPSITTSPENYFFSMAIQMLLEKDII